MLFGNFLSDSITLVTWSFFHQACHIRNSVLHRLICGEGKILDRPISYHMTTRKIELLLVHGIFSLISDTCIYYTRM